MKSTIIASIAALATAVAASDSSSSCWMTLGAYSNGGEYCVAPLPDFSDNAGCQASSDQCSQEYAECKAKTQSTSACLQLMAKCQAVDSWCDDFCTADSSGNVSQYCNLPAAISGTRPTDDNSSSDTPASSDVPVASSAAPMSTAVPTPVVQQATSTRAITPTQAATSAAALVTPDVPCGQCYTDNRYRGLVVQKQAPSGQGMTIQLCMSLCSGYKYTGLEYGSECFCGNDLKNGVQATTGCDMHCSGDTSQTCGGDLKMNIYQQGCAAPVSVKASSAAAYNPVKSSSVVAAYGYATLVKSTTAAAYGYNTPAKSTVAAYGYNTPAKTTAAAYAPAKTTTKSTAAAYNPAKTYAVSKSTATPTVGICNIPSAYSSPVGGYKAPIVACNDLSDYTSSPWKLYTSKTSSLNAVYGQSSAAKACTDACTAQYNTCIAKYAVPLKPATSSSSYSSYSSYRGYRARRGVDARNVKRTFWAYGTPSTTTTTYGTSSSAYNAAVSKCSSQKTACLAANSNLVVKGTCSSGGTYKAPASSSGSNYNSGYNTYGAQYRAYY